MSEFLAIFKSTTFKKFYFADFLKIWHVYLLIFKF